MEAFRRRTCNKCGGAFEEIGFRRNEFSGKYTCQKYRSARRPTCRICEITARGEVDLFLVKARRTFEHHARRFLKQGIINNKDELRTRYDWHIKQIAHDMEHAYKNGCFYCHQPFASMKHGPGDLTLDIFDPGKPPDYTNVRWACRNCNAEKQRMPPEEFAGYKRYCREYQEWQEELAKNPLPRNGPQLRLAFDLPKDDGNGKGEQLALL